LPGSASGLGVAAIAHREARLLEQLVHTALYDSGVRNGQRFYGNAGLLGGPHSLDGDRGLLVGGRRRRLGGRGWGLRRVVAREEPGTGGDDQQRKGATSCKDHFLLAALATVAVERWHIAFGLCGFDRDAAAAVGLLTGRIAARQRFGHGTFEHGRGLAAVDRNR
jgi:hypothetical protein